MCLIQKVKESVEGVCKGEAQLRPWRSELYHSQTNQADLFLRDIRHQPVANCCVPCGLTKLNTCQSQSGVEQKYLFHREKSVLSSSFNVKICSDKTATIAASLLCFFRAAWSRQLSLKSTSVLPPTFLSAKEANWLQNPLKNETDWKHSLLEVGKTDKLHLHKLHYQLPQCVVMQKWRRIQTGGGFSVTNWQGCSYLVNGLRTSVWTS